MNADNASSRGGVPLPGNQAGRRVAGGPSSRTKCGSSARTDLPIDQRHQPDRRNLSAIKAFSPISSPSTTVEKSAAVLSRSPHGSARKHEFRRSSSAIAAGSKQDQATAADPVFIGGVGGSLVQGRVKLRLDRPLALQVSAAWNNKSLATETRIKASRDSDLKSTCTINTFLSSGPPDRDGELVRENNVQDLFLQPSSQIVIEET